MVKLTRTSAPEELDLPLIALLTDRYKQTQESVWDLDFLKAALLAISDGKCCYCECKIDEESKYLEVEHYKPKSKYEDLVVVWDNLLPSCKRCNGKKGKFDTGIYPFINPTIDDPRVHLQLKVYRFYSRDTSQFGKNAIDILDLNDRDRLVVKRFEIGNKICEALSNIDDEVSEYMPMVDGLAKVRKRNKIVRMIHNLLLEAQPSSEYSATAATIIISNEHYQHIKGEMINLHLWNADLDQLDAVANAISLE